ncbi:MAG: response regulator, partial [Clostridia bacterium]|nr:response regulator [Clostridia bacterium]
MDPAFLPKLFDPFAQEDATTTNRYGGSGLGMAITKNMVDLMGGQIDVESEKGRGTTFTVHIPLKKASHVEGAPEAETPVLTLAGLHMLIAEDMALNAEILTDLLEMEDVTSEWAENGRRAVEMFEGSAPGHFSAILMDMRMPVMDGLAATRAIRALDRPDAATIPIIALTANAFEEDVRQCLQAGMNAHLSKPVEMDQLKAALRREASPLGRRVASPLGRREASPLGRRVASPLG